MSKAIDILVNGENNFTPTSQEIIDDAEEMAKTIKSGMNKAMAGIAGATTAIEVFNRNQRQLTETLRRTAYYMDASEEDLRSLAVAIADVTRPTEDVVNSFQVMMQMGVQNEQQMARLAIAYDSLTDALGADMVNVVSNAGTMFHAFGENIASVEQYSDKLTHTFNSTVLRIEDFITVMRRSARFVGMLNMDMDEALSVMMAMADQTGNSVQAMYNFQRGARHAQGDMEAFREFVGLTKEEIEEYTDRLEDTTGETEEMAQKHADAYTPIQRLLSITDRLRLEYGRTIEAVGSLMTGMLGLTAVFWSINTISTTFVGTIKAVGTALSILNSALGLIGITTMGVKALLLALPLAVAYAVETVTDPIKMLGLEMKQAESYAEQLTNLLAQERHLGRFWSIQARPLADEISDILGEEVQLWTEDDIKDAIEKLEQHGSALQFDFEEPLRLEESIDDLQRLREELQKASREDWVNQPEREEDLRKLEKQIDELTDFEDVELITEDDLKYAREMVSETMDLTREELEELDSGGWVRQQLSGMLSGMSSLVERGVKGLENVLFDTLDAMDFEDVDMSGFDELMQEFGDDTTIGVSIDPEDIEAVRQELKDRLEALDIKLDEGVIEEGFEYTSKQAQSVTDAITELMDIGLKPTDSLIGDLTEKFVGYASQLEHTEETAEFVKENFIDLINSGLRPTTEGYDELIEILQTFGAEIPEDEMAKMVERKNEIIDAMNEEIASLQQVEEEYEAMGREFDTSRQQQNVYKRAVEELMEVHGVAGDAIRDIIIEIMNLDEEVDTLADDMQKARGQILQLAVANREFGDTIDLTADKVSVAQSAKQRLIQAIADEEIAFRDAKEEIEFFNRIIAMGDVDNYANQIEDLNDQLDHIDEMERLGLIDDADERRLRILNQMIELMVENGEHMNEETGELTEEFENLVEKAEELEAQINDTGHELTRMGERFADMLNEIEKAPEIGEVLGWDDVPERQLRTIDRMINEMMENEKTSVEIKEGQVVTLDQLIWKQMQLNEEINKTTHNWGTVYETIRGNVSAFEAIEDVIENIRGFDFSEMRVPDISLPDIGIDIGGMVDNIRERFGRAVDFASEHLSGFGNTIMSFISPLGTITSLLMPIIQQSRHFETVMETLNRILEPVVDVFGILLEAFYPFIRVIEMTLVPILNVLGDVLRLLILPVFRMLFPVLKWFGVVVLMVGEAIASIAGIVSSTAREMARDMREARRELQDLTWDDLQKELDETEEGFSDVNEELHHVPQGYKVALSQFRAMSEEGERATEAQTAQAQSMAQTDDSGGVQAQASGGTTQTTQSNNQMVSILKKILQAIKTLSTGDVNVNATIVSDDPEEIWREIKQIAEKERYQQTGTMVETQNRYA